MNSHGVKHDSEISKTTRSCFKKLIFHKNIMPDNVTMTLYLEHNWNT